MKPSNKIKANTATYILQQSCCLLYSCKNENEHILTTNWHKRNTAFTKSASWPTTIPNFTGCGGRVTGSSRWWFGRRRRFATGNSLWNCFTFRFCDTSIGYSSCTDSSCTALTRWHGGTTTARWRQLRTRRGRVGATLPYERYSVIKVMY